MNSFLYSFDIFDTCLIRACGTPNCIWHIMAHHILGSSADKASISDFVLVRRIAEGKAREQLINETKEDITLEDIYAFCDFSKLTNIPNHAIMQTEMDIEEKMLVPVKSVMQEISHLHEEGINIIFISDMYLPEEFIKRILVNTNLFKDGDKLYISGTVGKSKSTGHLYDYVKKELNSNFNHWVHKGDNKQSDYEIPRRKGIKAKHIIQPFSYYEQKTLEHNLGLSSPDIKVVASISRATRLQMNDEPSFRFAADFIAPMMTTFVHQIFDDATQRSIKHLYFMARDAYILYIIAHEFTPLYPTISIHYLYASRQSLYEPDENCLPYLHQEGLTRPNSAIVDMVGTRRCQCCINDLFFQNGYPKIFAYYYEVTPYRIMSHNKYYAMYYQEKMASSPYYHHASHPIFEQYFGITNQLRTIGYQKKDGKYVPIFEPDMMNSDYKLYIYAINKEVCSTFAKYYVNTYIEGPRICSDISYAIFSHFCHVPRRDYLLALDGFFSTSSTSTKETLLEKRNLISVLFNKKHYLRWRNGNLVYNSGGIYKLVMILLDWYYKRKLKNK